MADLQQAAAEVVRRASRAGVRDKAGLNRVKNSVCQELGLDSFADSVLLAAYQELRGREGEAIDPALEAVLRKRSIRTLSGIAPVSVLLPPAPCKSACVYCPSERVDQSGKTLFAHDSEKKYGKKTLKTEYETPGALVMPKSYLSSEPGAMRALLAGFDPALQISRRLEALAKTGHLSEKCELIVQGGTFSDLPEKSREDFITRCYHAFNSGDPARPESLAAAQQRNETAAHRVVGLTLETRPGSVTPAELRAFRRLGCTRVEIGVQTLDDEITRKTRRLQTTAEVRTATRLLRQAGMKICYHLMPGLPFSTPEKDLATYRQVVSDPDFMPDLVKIYPCAVVPFSELALWHRQGRFTPYSEETLFALLRQIKLLTPPFIRISRLVRDIPGTAILAGSKVTNLRQLLQEKMRKDGEHCRCIRCREIRDDDFDPDQAQLTERPYRVTGGQETFLSFELPDQRLLSMLRLFCPDDPNASCMPELRGAVVIRELHTYGAAVALGKRQKEDAQHSGFGGRLLAEAESIAKKAGFRKLAVISGIGVKDYYRKRGFVDAGTYLVKEIRSGV